MMVIGTSKSSPSAAIANSRCVTRFALSMAGCDPAKISYQLDGAVSPRGEIHVKVEEKGRSASGIGRLTHDAGHGQWHTSTNECAGHWTAARRG